MTYYVGIAASTIKRKRERERERGGGGGRKEGRKEGREKGREGGREGEELLCSTMRVCYACACVCVCLLEWIRGGHVLLEILPLANSALADGGACCVSSS